MNRTHPLEIPEILSRVGRHVPLWVHTRPSSSYYYDSSSKLPLHSIGPPYFDPRHLLACIQVNRTWHDIFLPILCFSFDDTAVHTSPITTVLTTTTALLSPLEDAPGTGTGAAVVGSPETTTAVKKTITTHPAAVRLFLRNSQRFRLMVLTRPCAPILDLPPSLLPVHLLHLELVGLDDETIPYFRSSLSFAPSSASLSSTATTASTAAASSSQSSSFAWSKALILQNTRLQSLRWQGGDFQRDNHGMLDSLALAEKLHRLQDLVLECWRLDQGFVELLRRNPGLRTLALDFVTGEALPPLPSMLSTEQRDVIGMSESSSSSRSSSSSPYLLSLVKIPTASSSGAYASVAKSSSSSPSTATTTTAGRYPPEWNDSNHHSYNHHNNNTINNPKCNPNPYGFQLLHLTCLSVCKDVESGAFETLVRLCPNLEELSWMGPLDSDLEALTLNLSQCCPRVAVLTYSTVDISEPEHRYADFVRSLPALVDLQIRIPTLEGGHFARALLEQHAGSLEILDLRIVNRRSTAMGADVDADVEASEQKSREHLRRILMGCSELTALSIEGAERMSEYLFRFTWACSHRLHRLFLGASITYGGSIDAADDDDEGVHEGAGNVGVTDQHQQQQQGQQEQDLDHGNQGGTDRAQSAGASAVEFMAEAALFGWSVVGSSGTSVRHHRDASGTDANGFDGDHNEGEDEEGDVIVGSSGSSDSESMPMSPSEYLDGISCSHSAGLTDESNFLYQSSNRTACTTSTSTSIYDEDTTMPNATSTLASTQLSSSTITTTTQVSSSSSSLILSSSPSLSSLTPGSTSPSFVRDMMNRLDDMPRLQSFVLNNVEYTRIPPLIAP